MKSMTLEENRYFRRFSNYCEESIIIEKKLKNSDISPGKRGKLNYRLKLLREKLIPDLVSNLQEN